MRHALPAGGCRFYRAADSRGSLECSIGCSIECPIECSIECSIESFIEHSIERSIERSMECSIECFIECSIECSMKCSIEGSIECSIERSIDSSLRSRARGSPQLLTHCRPFSARRSGSCSSPRWTFFLISRSMPTANAEGPCEPEGTSKDTSHRDLSSATLRPDLVGMRRKVVKNRTALGPR